MQNALLSQIRATWRITIFIRHFNIFRLESTQGKCFILDFAKHFQNFIDDTMI